MQTNRFKSLITGSKKLFTKKRVAILAGFLIAFMITVPVVTYATYARDIADKERLMNRNNTGIILRDKNGEIFYEYGKLNGYDDVSLDEVSDVLENALIASEDENFRNHAGYSIKGMAAAFFANIMNKDATRYGGSTITQQLVKNKLLSSDKNYLRKYQEVAMAVAIERRYSKDEILEMYLNSVYFGEGAFGIADAAKTYYNKKPSELTLAESSMLVGLLPAPSTYSPVSGDKDLAKGRQDYVLGRMAEVGMITQSEKDSASSINLAYQPLDVINQEYAQHFAEMVINELKEKHGEEKMIRAGFDVKTSLDLGWQKHAESIARDRVRETQAAGARNVGLVALDPKTGQIRALVGSVDWNNPTFGKVNMTIRERQPGSSFKPIYYTEAIRKKVITPATVIKDEPTTFGGNYSPTNYDFKYRGDITVRNALSQSLNVPAVKVMEKLGVNESADAARRVGLSTVDEPEKYGLSLALGTAEVKLLELAHAYTAFAHKGDQYPLTQVLAIRDKYNEKVFDSKQANPKNVTSPEASYLISSILSDQQARSATFGNRLNIPGKDVAVKTGTTNDSKDAWTVGYTPGVVVGVWMGNNENQPMIGLAGSSSAGKVWKDTMSRYVESLPEEDFFQPGDVITAKICNATGTYEEKFIKGTQPKDNCEKPKPVESVDKKPEDEEDKPEKPENNEDEKPEDSQQDAQNSEDSNGEEEQPNGTGNNGTDDNSQNSGGGRGGGGNETTSPGQGSGDSTQSAPPSNNQSSPSPTN